MSHTYILDLPELIDGDRAEFLQGEEIAILDIAEAVINQGDASLTVHLDAIRMAEELAEYHDGYSTVTDEAMHYYAEQLKLYHLDLLARYFRIAEDLIPVADERQG